MKNRHIDRGTVQKLPSARILSHNNTTKKYSKNYTERTLSPSDFVSNTDGKIILVNDTYITTLSSTLILGRMKKYIGKLIRGNGLNPQKLF